MGTLSLVSCGSEDDVISEATQSGTSSDISEAIAAHEQQLQEMHVKWEEEDAKRIQEYEKAGAVTRAWGSYPDYILKKGQKLDSYYDVTFYLEPGQGYEIPDDGREIESIGFRVRTTIYNTGSTEKTPAYIETYVNGLYVGNTDSRFNLQKDYNIKIPGNYYYNIPLWYAEDFIVTNMIDYALVALLNGMEICDYREVWEACGVREAQNNIKNVKFSSINIDTSVLKEAYVEKTINGSNFYLYEALDLDWYTLEKIREIFSWDYGIWGWTKTYNKNYDF